MNVLLFQFGDVFAKRIVANVLQGLESLQHVYAVTAMPTMPPGQSLPPQVQLTEIHPNNLIYGHYKGINWQEVPPLDPETLQAFAHLEHQFTTVANRYNDARQFVPPAQRPKGLTRWQWQWARHTGSRWLQTSLPYETRRHLYYQCLRYWLHHLKQWQISVVVSQFEPHGLYDYLPTQVARHLGIPVVSSWFTHIAQHVTYYTDYTQSNAHLPKVYQQVQQQYSPDSIPLNEYFESQWQKLTAQSQAQQMPYYMYEQAMQELQKKVNNIEQANRKASGAGARSSGARSGARSGPKAMLKRSLKTAARLTGLKAWWHKNSDQQRLHRYYESLCQDPNFEQPYIYVPLHFQPEATSMPLGGIYFDQHLMVQQLSYHLPQGWKLYVKEHPYPSNRYYRSQEYYRRLKEIPHVQLISKSINTYELLEHSRATASLTGLAGWEGLFKGKPYLLFGYHSSQYGPGVLPVRSSAQMQQAMQKLQQGYTPNLTQLRYFMRALQETALHASSDKYDYIQMNITEEELAQRAASGYLGVLKALGFAMQTNTTNPPPTVASMTTDPTTGPNTQITDS